MKDFLRAWNPDDEGTVEYHEFRVWCPGADDEGKEIIARNAKEAAESWAELFDLDGIGVRMEYFLRSMCLGSAPLDTSRNRWR